MPNKKLPYFVCWTKWNKTKPKWRPIRKFQRCSTFEKAKRLKKLLESQVKIIHVYISKVTDEQ